MAIHKLKFDDFYDETYQLIAIHSTIEDYRLAYLINKNCGVNLKRHPKDLDINNTKTAFSFYEYRNKKQDCTWHFITNTFKSKAKPSYATQSLFDLTTTEIVQMHYFLPSNKSVNFFLKLSNQTDKFSNKINNILQNIPEIITSYNIDITKIKYKDRLMF